MQRNCYAAVSMKSTFFQQAKTLKGETALASIFCAVIAGELHIHDILQNLASKMGWPRRITDYAVCSRRHLEELNFAS